MWPSFRRVPSILNKTAEDIAHLVERLTRDAALARRAGVEHAARLIEIAILDVQTTRYGISDNELRGLVDAIGECRGSGKIVAFPKKNAKAPKKALGKVRRD